MTDLISEALAQRILDAALTTGGDYSELYMEDKETNSVMLQQGSVEQASYRRSAGAGVRVLKGGRCAYAYTADTGEDALIKTAKAAAAALNEAKAHSPAAFSVYREAAYRAAIPLDTVDNAARIKLLREAEAAARSVSPEISQVTAQYADVTQRVHICNSLGVWAEDNRPRTRIYVSAVAANGTEYQQGSDAPGRGEGFETFKTVDAAKVGRTAANTAVTMLHAPQCPAGCFPVVIDGGFGGVILHEACVHSLEATSVARGNSEFCNKLGQKIASDIVTAVDDGTLPGEWGSIRVDDEGTPSRRNVLIENGILKTYLVDLVGSRLMDHPLTGSSRRESYAYAPTSRMTNTFFAPGTDDGEEMIRTMGEGLFAKKMGGGSVNPLTGEFNFAVDEGYYVKDGKIFSPVRGATLIGRGADVLLRIDRIAKDMWMGQGMCGSASGSVPTNVGQPRIRVTEITVGGKGGAL